jgi:hypothetical protein
VETANGTHLDGSRVDQTVDMTVLRFGKLVELTVRPAERRAG